jgi:hypothetical protein
LPPVQDLLTDTLRANRLDKQKEEGKVEHAEKEVDAYGGLSILARQLS